VGKYESISIEPPAPTAAAVRAHRRKLESSLVALKASAAQSALASARGEAGAEEALAGLYLKIRATEFEIECNPAAFELANQQDTAAEAAWRASIQRMDPAEIIAGIDKEACCRRCTPGSPGGCVLTASAPYSGGTCSHPVRERHLFNLDERGRRLFPYRSTPQASILFDAACEKLKVRGDFV